ncbi:MAG TPA: HIT family protein [Melioribacteraceae bacterium]|nr:HIT family protein [Melioribacteraceae bacterium]
MENCIFCKIANGEIPCNKVYEDENVISFMDINPINKGHLLVIPKKHFQEVKDYDDEIGGKLFNVAVKIEKAIRKVEGIKLEATSFVIANGKAAGQEVFHSHLHIIPRYENDNMTTKINRTEKSSAEELKNLANLINNNI